MIDMTSASTRVQQSITFAVFLLFFHAPISIAADSAASDVNQEARQSQLLPALSSDDWVLRRRALQELQLSSLDGSQTLTNALQMLSAKSVDAESYDLVRLISLHVQSNCTVVYRSLSSLNGFRASLLCSAVGRSGTSCSNLVNLLQQAVESGSDNASTSARVALASLGVDREANLTAIQRTLNTSTNRGSVVLAMLLTRLGDWAAEPVLPSLEVLIRRQNDDSVLAAVLVGSWEQKGQTALASIKEAAERSKTNSNQGAALLFYEFSKARLEKEGKHWITAELLRLLASDRVGFDHSVMSGCLLISGFLLNDGDISDVVWFLGDSDHNVVLGASRLCWIIGIPARSAEKRMLELVESSKEERIRLSAALALGTLGSAQSLSRIRALEAKETSATVKTSLAAAQRLISLHPIGADN